MRRYLKAKSSEKLPPSPQWTLEVNIYIHKYKLLEVFLVKLVIIFCMMTTRTFFSDLLLWDLFCEQATVTLERFPEGVE